MTQLFVIVIAIAALTLVMRREAGATPAIAALAAPGLIGLLFGAPGTGFLLLLAAGGTAACGHPELRRKWLTPRIFATFKKIAPKVSATEWAALEAGTVGWDGELFSGKPDWNRLVEQRDSGLSAEEQAFLDNQCTVAAGMCNAWDIGFTRTDLPEELWNYLKKEGFFGMIIPKEYGGLGFSAKAQSMVLQKLMVVETLMVSVGVPNSLGPGELLLKYGTKEQKDYYLPRLADGREMPCFGLTGPRAGSDATSIPDTGIVCKGMHEGKEVLGLRLNFEKRWITMAPIATVVGLAFRMFDPDGLLGGEEDLGITCALIPRDTEGVEIGRRHYPIGTSFMNGPIRGKDVFIPLDYIIGGPEMAGQGWRMLVECLSVGRCITLPSGVAGVGRYSLATAGGFTRIRRQFNVPVAEMEGVQEALARIAGLTFIAESAVRHTANMIDFGGKPSVPSAILKCQLTEFQRRILGDAMDVHGGKTVTLGPRNYLGLAYAGSPVPITVEGANIMTRSLMVFGQGAIRCHPYVLKELEAHKNDDIDSFDAAFFSHVGLVFGNAARAFTLALGIGRGTTPLDGTAAPYALAVNRFSAALGLCADAAMISLGASLKFRELLSARLGDVLSNLYLTTMVLKHWNETDHVADEDALLHYSCHFLLNRAEQAFHEVLENLPNRPLAWALRAIVMPTGRRWSTPSDDWTRRVATAISTASPLRAKLCSNTWDTWEEGQQDNPLYHYQRLLANYGRAEPLYGKVNRAYAKGELPMQALHPEDKIRAAEKAGVLSAEEARFMLEFEAEVLEMLTVDDFPFDELAHDKASVYWHPSVEGAPAKPKAPKPSSRKKTGGRKAASKESPA